VVAHFIISALTNKKINIFGDGKQVRDLLYISDLVEAYDSYVKKSSTIKNDVYCIGGGINNALSLLELIEILEKEINLKIEYTFHNWRPSDQKIYITDITKVSKDLDWKPKVNPERGIKKIIKWVSNNINLFKVSNYIK